MSSARKDDRQSFWSTPPAAEAGLLVRRSSSHDRKFSARNHFVPHAELPSNSGVDATKQRKLA